MKNFILSPVMKVVSFAALGASLLISNTTLANSYNGTTTTYGNTTYHSGSLGTGTSTTYGNTTYLPHWFVQVSIVPMLSVATVAQETGLACTQHDGFSFPRQTS